jgi:hypothetical protein
MEISDTSITASSEQTLAIALPLVVIQIFHAHQHMLMQGYFYMVGNVQTLPRFIIISSESCHLFWLLSLGDNNIILIRSKATSHLFNLFCFVILNFILL